MTASRDAASAQATLNYWMDVEALTPSLVEKDDGQERGVQTHGVSDKSAPVDWTMGQQDPRKLQKVSSVARVCLFKSGVAATAIAEAMGVQPDGNVDGNGQGRDAFLAAFSVGTDGRPLNQDCES